MFRDQRDEVVEVWLEVYKCREIENFLNLLWPTFKKSGAKSYNAPLHG